MSHPRPPSGKESQRLKRKRERGRKTEENNSAPNCVNRRERNGTQGKRRRGVGGGGGFGGNDGSFLPGFNPFRGFVAENKQRYITVTRLTLKFCPLKGLEQPPPRAGFHSTCPPRFREDNDTISSLSD